MYIIFFFFNDTATTEIYTLSLHDALPIYTCWWNKQDTLDNDDNKTIAQIKTHTWDIQNEFSGVLPRRSLYMNKRFLDRKSTRLNSSHANISYAVFCLKKKKNISTPSTSLS